MRQLIGSILIVVGCGASSAFSPDVRPAPTPSVVYTVGEPAAIERYRTNSAVVRAMVDRAVVAVTGATGVASAWSSMVSPGDRIGIKISARRAARRLPPIEQLAGHVEVASQSRLGNSEADMIEVRDVGR